MMIVALKRIRSSWDSKRIVDLSKKGGLYFGSSALGMIISFFTVPIFSTLLSERDFAIFNYCNNLAGFFVFAFSLQFTSYYSANYFRANEEEKKSLTSTLISFLLLWNAVIVCVVYGILIIYCNLVNLTLPYYPYLIFSVLITAITIFKGFYLTKLRLDGNALKYFLINSLHKIIGIAVGISLMYIISNHLEARLWGLLSAEVALGAYCLKIIYNNCSFFIEWQTIKKAFTFIYPLIGASLIYFPITGLDQIALERLNNTSELGYYTLGITFASYIFMFHAAILQAVEPDIIKATIQRNFKKLSKITILFLAFCAGGSLVFMQISGYLIDFLTRGRFILSTGYCNILTVSFFFLVVFSIANIILIALQKSKAIFYTNLFGCIASIGGYFLLAHFFGFYGVAIGRTVIYLFMAVLAFVFIRKEFKRLSIAENQQSDS
ncbi:MAG: hypothetical protein EOO46_09390 [Flavobacterium sp.]|nr:MAG: hypothetical protein EOO46_09390 [Flavobacterium sp.]